VSSGRGHRPLRPIFPGARAPKGDCGGAGRRIGGAVRLGYRCSSRLASGTALQLVLRDSADPRLRSLVGSCARCGGCSGDERGLPSLPAGE